MGKLRNLTLILFVAVFITACGAAPQGTNVTVSDIGNVEGTVTDSSNSAALSGVTVQIGDKTATTGSNGVYSIQDVSVGTRTVTASKTGYQNHNGTCTVNKGTTVVHNIQLTANPTGDTTPPTVSSTSPANNAAGISVNSALTVAFSEAMDVSTITTTTFTLKQGTTPVLGTVTYSGTTATFTPSSNLSYSTTYTATISTGVKDAAGNAMASTYTWTFRTITIMSDTGQTTSYTSTFGEDHDYTINPPSYSDNGDGTIRDNVTGLLWQKQDDGVSRTRDNAVTYCNNLTLAGQTGWRLPSQIELISIVDYGVSSSPTINTTYFTGTSSFGYWSSTINAYNPSFLAWAVYFSNGASGTEAKMGSSYGPMCARCVRGGQIPQSLTDNGNGTVTDSGTNLTWQQGENSTMTWEAALSYCEGLSLAGQSDWRVPNIKELLSLVDYTRYSPSINTTFFPNTYSLSYWSSTTGSLGVFFNNGSSAISGNYNYARCVRGGQ